MHPMNRCFVRLVVFGAAVLLSVVVYLTLSQRQIVADEIMIVQDLEPCVRPIAAAAAANNSTRLILFWTSYFARDDFYWGYGRRSFTRARCPVDACETTSDRDRLSEADAVVFHIRDLNPLDLPKVRRTCQRWIFFLMETPYYTYVDLTSYSDFFNWTFTYRFDSDIPPRIHLRPKSDIENRTTDMDDVSASRRNRARGKTRLAVWLVSNCRTYSHRERYVDELRKYVPIDVFGECGDVDDDATCGTDTPLRQCYRTFERRYKFYLAFENSMCQDYFSEKLYNIFDHDMVPVVLGKVDYTSFAPPHSLIDASLFATPAALAAELRRLDEDDDAYGAYFDWKRDWTFSIVTSPWCDVCSKLNDPSAPKKTYADIDAWWVRGGNCTNDIVGNWTIASFYDQLVDTVAIKYSLFKHRAKSIAKNLKS